MTDSKSSISDDDIRKGVDFLRSAKPRFEEPIRFWAYCELCEAVHTFTKDDDCYKAWLTKLKDLSK